MKQFKFAVLVAAILGVVACTTADGPPRTDAEIRAAVLTEIAETQIDASRVTVGVTNAVVTLDGVVSSTAQRDAAEAAAHRVKNVARVTNNLRVQ